MCNRWKSGRDLPSIRAAGRNIPLMTCVCSMAKANSRLLSCFFSQGKFYAKQLEPLRGVLILDSLMCGLWAQARSCKVAMASFVPHI